uniref:Putative secreted protein n=1 Tax=Ixodes ricinus TaxID=34613 RepID=A0A6B0UVL6_IXORI
MGLGRLKAILLRLVVGVVSQGHLFLIHVVQRVQGFTDVVVASVDVGLRRGRGGSIHDRRHLLLGHRETASLLEELVQLRHAHGLVQVGWHVLQGRALLLNLQSASGKEEPVGATGRKLAECRYYGARGRCLRCRMRSQDAPGKD